MKRSLTISSLCVAFLFGSLACKGSNKDGGAKAIRVTGIPDENPTRLAREYEPLVKRLEAALDAPVRYVPVTDYGAAVQALAADQVDFAWLGGFTHVQARNLAEVVPLAMRDIDREFRTVFIARIDGPVRRMEDVATGSLAFGSKSSTSGHLMPRHFLKENYSIDVADDLEKAPLYSGAHDATVKLVVSGKVDVGAVNSQVWQRMVSKGEVDAELVQVLWTTPPYSDYVWTAREAVPTTTREAFASFFLGLDASNEADAELLDMLGASRYVPAAASDFDTIEEVARRSGLLK